MKKIFILVLMIIAGMGTAKAQEFDQPFHSFVNNNMMECDGKLYLSTRDCGIWVSDKGKDNWQLHKESEIGGSLFGGMGQVLKKIKNRIVIPTNNVSIDSGKTWIKTNRFTSIQYSENRNYCSLNNTLFSSNDDIDSVLFGDTLSLHLDTIKLPEGELSWFRTVGTGDTIFVSIGSFNPKFYVSTNIGKDWTLIPYASKYSKFVFFNDRVISYVGYNEPSCFVLDNSGKLLHEIDLKNNASIQNLYLDNIINNDNKPVLCCKGIDSLNRSIRDSNYYFSILDDGKILTPFAEDLPIDFSLIQIEKVDDSFYYIGSWSLYKSTDNGITKKSITSGMHANIADIFVNDSFILVGSNNDHYLLKSTDKGKTWNQTGKGINSYLYQLKSYKNAIYAFSKDGYFKSVDNGEKFSKCGETNGHYSSDKWFITDSCFINFNSEGFEISYDEGKSWDSKKINKLKEVVTANNNIIIYVRDSIFISTDNGRTFEFQTKKTLGRIKYFQNALYAREIDASNVYSNYIKSYDMGKTWEQTDDIPKKIVDGYLIKENVFVRSNELPEIEISKDYGNSWVKAKSKRSFQYSLERIVINQNTLYCGVMGQGLLSLDLTPLLNSSGVENDLVLMPNKVNVYPNPTTDFVNYTINLESEANVEAEIYSSSGKLLMTDSKGILTQGKHSLFSMVNELPSGQYLMNIKIGDKTINSKFEIVR